ncbi:MAG: hypothetical protein A3G45_01760 [Candidatus Staskawiczbacteria bacterium RIFCSPLOWO2_12_FULL_37_15]|uniref:DUF2933 domain-containing protein n=1 Tax=Candidatus Staskawiczbacteria bacterium RIFCSPLOWO2_12_FULL_37_15 TaxID=1802218 RepID=A0A1G2IQD2_9BACT|nr:MAG: hypothetical protein US35_C0015G0023 [Parcubacteria group bacterium GW2011_GWA2_37_10]OGZ76580.1 MAG: hypothetical protein A3G45_01760 [Candidatus Staskawiczbacteria bacterium RIFCSPLOWO2_12_FULL_37_15]
MENQNNNNDMGGKMMWMMMLCCIAPFLFIFLSGVIASKGNWIAIVVMGIFVVGYLAIMNKMHNSHGGKSGNDKSDNSHSHGSHGHGCH